MNSYNNCEKGHEMYYEVYVDSLFVVNFVMNLYILMLVNGSTLRTATRRRLLAGAGVGALCYLVPFVLPIPAWVKYPVALIGGTGLMIHIAFRPGNIRGFMVILKWMFMYSFLMGGLLLFVRDNVPVLYQFTTEGWAVCGIGALCAMIISYISEKGRKRTQESSCRVTLINGGNRVTVEALLDSGNGLVEPVSGKSVSVVESDVYRALWGEGARPFRAIPYHSIGKKHGIMRGYLVQCMELEIGGVTKRLSDVYIAVSEESGKVAMIINPRVLNE